jgi:XTP/dITP diphosphohydrolase
VKREILFASNNEHKVNEVRQLLPNGYELLSLIDISWALDIPEPFNTYEDNAKAKSCFVFDRTGISCFADDSGLEIDALEGRPGVLSARYAGSKRSSIDNMVKVLEELGDKNNRTARFHSSIAFISPQNEIYVFNGNIEGKIGHEPLGDGGFGYDPIFIPDGFDQTFGQLPESLKNRISHRAIAMRKFMEFLKSAHQ